MQKLLLFILLCSVIRGSISAQEYRDERVVIVNGSEESQFYFGIENRLLLFVDNAGCENILVATDDAKIGGEPCNYSITFNDPIDTVNLELTVRTETGQQLVIQKEIFPQFPFSYEVHIRALQQQLKFKRSLVYEIEKQQLKQLKGLWVLIKPSLQIDVPNPELTYNILNINSGDELSAFGRVFSNDVMSFLERANEGNVLFIQDIKMNVDYLGCIGSDLNVYTIKEDHLVELSSIILLVK